MWTGRGGCARVDARAVRDHSRHHAHLVLGPGLVLCRGCALFPAFDSRYTNDVATFLQIIGLIAIVLFGIPNAVYNAVMPAWCDERFGNLGQGAVMGLLSTIFCLANIMMALAGAVLTLIDTRLILLLGAGLTASAAWRISHWNRLKLDSARPALSETTG